MWQIIRDLVAGGVTIFLTTQYLEEADQLADRIAVLDHGQLVAQGTPAELKRLIPGAHISLRFADAAGLDAAARLLGELGDGARDDAALTLRVSGDGSVAGLRALLNQLDSVSNAGGSAALADLSVHTPDLDDVFLALTGQPQPGTGRPQPASEREVLR
jgi:ABC-2 type transport system ATP-binding protein